MATLEELYKIREVFKSYDAPIPEKLAGEIFEAETPLNRRSIMVALILPNQQ